MPVTNETAAQMLRQNSDWLDVSIERANAQLAEANFQVLEDRLDASAELEISNHLQQVDWTDGELSNQIVHLQNDCITSKEAGFYSHLEPRTVQGEALVMEVPGEAPAEVNLRARAHHRIQALSQNRPIIGFSSC